MNTKIAVAVSILILALIAVGIYVYSTGNPNQVVYLNVIDANNNDQLEMIISGSSSQAQITADRMRESNMFMKIQLYEGFSYSYFSVDNGTSWKIISCQPSTIADIFPSLANSAVSKNSDGTYSYNGATVTINGDGTATAVVNGTSQMANNFQVYSSVSAAPPIIFVPSPSKIDTAICNGDSLMVLKNYNTTRILSDASRKLSSNSRCVNRNRANTVKEEYYQNWRLSLLSYNVPSEMTTPNPATNGLITNDDIRHPAFACVLPFIGSTCVETDMTDVFSSTTIYSNTQNGAAGPAGTYTWVIANKKGDAPGVCYIAMRGSYSLQDWASDAGSVFQTKWLLGGQNYNVGQGFKTFYLAIQQDIRNSLTSSACTSVKITGHSLGGAIADAVALDLYYFKPANFVTQIITFGQPRFFYQSGSDPNPPTGLVNIKTRIVNNYDPVSMVPVINYDSASYATLVFSLIGGIGSALEVALGSSPLNLNSMSGGANPFVQGIHTGLVYQCYSNNNCNYQDNQSRNSNWPNLSNFPNSYWAICVWGLCTSTSVQFPFAIGYVGVNILSHIEYDQTVCQ